MPAFYSSPEYIKVLGDSIAEGLKDFEYDHVLFSYHGIPERHVDKVYLDGKPCADHHCDEEINHENRILKNKSHSPSTNSKFDYYKYKFQTIIFKSHGKNLEMCRVLLNHEIMCR